MDNTTNSQRKQFKPATLFNVLTLLVLIVTIIHTHNTQRRLAEIITRFDSMQSRRAIGRPAVYDTTVTFYYDTLSKRPVAGRGVIITGDKIEILTRYGKD